MKNVLFTVISAMVALFITSAVYAQGELFLYNWTDYTSPEVIKKFEQETGVSVTLDTYDSNETLLAKLKQGGVGYDIVVPSHNFIPIFVAEKLLEPIHAKSLPGYNNIDDRWKNPSWDPGNVYTVPWQWGTTSYVTDSTVYDGDVNSYQVLFEPAQELQGKIGMFKSPAEIIPMAQIYLGIPICTESPDDMKRVLALLKKQKPHVKVYNSDGIKERLVSGDTAIHTIWNGYALRARQERPTLKYAYPREGVVSWFDNLAIPKGGKNKENALKFIAFMLRPENAALQSNFAKYSNGIKGSSAYMNEDLKSAPEINTPADMKAVFTETCSEAAIKLNDRVWTQLLK